MNKKITTTKLQVLGSYNLLKAKCRATGKTLASNEGLLVESNTNGGYYVSKNYFNKVTKGFTTYTQRQKLFICNLFVNGGTLTNKGKQAMYKVIFKNGKVIYLNGTNAEIKKYFNILKNLKTLISYTSFINIVNKWQNVNVGIMPTYAKQLQLFENGLSYNPNTKTSFIKYY